jgi:two-component system phosphate regulon sensor histidine kinase PhoR
MLLGALVGALVAFMAIRARAQPAASVPRTSATERTDLAEMARDRRRSTEIIERMSEGVVVLNEALTPVLANASARSLLGLPDVSLPTRLPSEEVVAVARHALDDDSGLEEIVRVWFPARMALRVHAAPLEDRGVVVVLQDVTQELLTQRIRREFVSSASHELKSPVASIRALGEALQQAAHDDPETTVRFARQVVAETERMTRLISDLLDLSRLEEAVEAPKNASDLSGVILRVYKDFRDIAEENEITLEANVASDVRILGDEQQLSLMTRNLLDNAIRYTGSNGKVSVCVYRDGREAVVEIEDDGIGIPLDSQERVFERFYRVDRARSRDKGGTGLGLAIVKHVVELHGGQISLESEPGQGTSFTIRLPAELTGRQMKPVAS